MSWNAKQIGGYLRTSDAAHENADIVRTLLMGRGWHINPICAIMGNMGHESGYNPWRWQSDDVPTRAEFAGWSVAESRQHGYGLFQYTPADKYIDNVHAIGLAGYSPHMADEAGSAQDGAAQLLFMDLGYSGYSPTSSYNISFADFKISDLSVDFLTGAWLYNFERPAHPEQSIDTRIENANYWYEYYTGHPPTLSVPIIALLKQSQKWREFY